MRTIGTAGILLASAACSGSAARKPLPPPAVAPAPPTVPDSLVLTSPDGSEVWLTEGRVGRDPAGGTCAERSVEIRRGERKIRVPLLYTGTAPVIRGAHEIEAELWLDCRPMARYRVDLETGRPTKLGAK